MTESDKGRLEAIRGEVERQRRVYALAQASNRGDGEAYAALLNDLPPAESDAAIAEAERLLVGDFLGLSRERVDELLAEILEALRLAI